MSTFVQALDKMSLSAPALRGENDTLEYSAEQVGDCLVAFFFALVRDLPDDRLGSLFQQCLDTVRLQPRVSASVLADLFVLAFQTRDCRGGKGERALFHKLLLLLYKEYPQTVKKTLPLIAEYGSYKDYFALLALLDERQTEREGEREDDLQREIVSLLARQLLRDRDALDAKEREKETESESATPSSSLSLSLCAKFAPREGAAFAKKHKSVFKHLLAALFPEHSENARNVPYRRLLTRLTAALSVVEVKMCAHAFAEIDYAKVPSLAMGKYRKAFLNEKLKEVPSTPLEESRGNRLPEDEDRVASRAHLREIALNKAHLIKGAQLAPHEISKKFMFRMSFSTLECDVIQAQWESMRADIQRQLDEKHEKEIEKKKKMESEKNEERPAVDLGKLVPLVDVSGSMSGTPMEVAIALGILVSEMNQPAFRDRFITFESNPCWVAFPATAKLQEKVKIAQCASWGGSTDIEKAFALIEAVVVENALKAEDVPDLIIFSDMQFDEATGRGSNLTQLQRVKARFEEIGIKLSGKPYAPPRIVFWNLRGNTRGFPAIAAEENVQMLSGYSPALFKALVCGETAAIAAEAAANAGEAAAAAAAVVTPYMTMRGVLDDSRYDAVRVLLSESGEGALREYSYVAPAPLSAEDEAEQSKRRRVTMAAGRGGAKRSGGRGRGRGRR